MMASGEPIGDIVNLRATHPSHFGFTKPPEKDDNFISDFGKALRDAFYKVNNLQNQSDRMTRALAVNPDSVDVHDVTIAAEKARLALTLTKSIVDRITQTYRELINLR
jgi:flagellar hook-basal body complex protein FliE